MSTEEGNTGEDAAKQRDDEQRQKDYTASRKGKTKEELEKMDKAMTSEEVSARRDYEARIETEKKKKRGGE